MSFALPGPNRKIADRSVEIFDQGTGAPLVYLHSILGVEASFPLLERLAEHFRVIAPSHPGFGASELPRSFSTVEDLAYHYLDLLDAFDLTGATLVGASFGGWIAAAVAIKNLARIRKLVLIDALGAKFGAPDAVEIADIFRESYRDVRKLHAYDGRPDERDLGQLPAEDVARMVRNREALTLFGWAPLLHDPKLRQRLYRIKVPTLVLWGENDRIVGADYGRSYAAAIPGARFEVIPATGHLPQDDKPALVADRITAFIGS